MTKRIPVHNGEKKVEEKIRALWLFFFGFLAIGIGLLHYIVRVIAEAPPNLQLMGGLIVAGVALLIAGGTLWKR